MLQFLSFIVAAFYNYIQKYNDHLEKSFNTLISISISDNFPKILQKQ